MRQAPGPSLPENDGSLTGFRSEELPGNGPGQGEAIGAKRWRDDQAITPMKSLASRASTSRVTWAGIRWRGPEPF
ncbi:hypothetical protein Pla8534_33180 [Lignipirellula cremea]|uniref:Uncharacterized protein n=1 Tax=Lignipirellula cremea TaxID=2528010 RepID=A0A518DUI8_9BACT|nr:hypothetical protein Pla8534_33180 [Lignipirellula cremea]